MNRLEQERSLEAIYLGKMVSIRTPNAPIDTLEGRICSISIEHTEYIIVQLEAAGNLRLRIPFKDIKDMEDNMKILTQNGNTSGESGGDVLADI